MQIQLLELVVLKRYKAKGKTLNFVLYFLSSAIVKGAQNKNKWFFIWAVLEDCFWDALLEAEGHLTYCDGLPWPRKQDSPHTSSTWHTAEGFSFSSTLPSRSYRACQLLCPSAWAGSSKKSPLPLLISAIDSLLLPAVVSSHHSWADSLHARCVS